VGKGAGRELNIWMIILRIAFRQLQETDLLLMHRWLNTPHVSRWWGIHGHKCPSLDEVRRHYLPRIHGKDPAKCYVVTLNGGPIGMVQSYQLDDYPSEKAIFDLDQNCAGIDIFIGEEDRLYQGLGSIIMKKFLKEIVFANYNVSCCIVDPAPENKAAIKAYKKAGFKYLKTVWNQQDAIDAYIMSVNRDEFYPDRKKVKPFQASKIFRK
jgi:RimJ/RimL family protein N-acetyltransferase